MSCEVRCTHRGPGSLRKGSELSALVSAEQGWEGSRERACVKLMVEPGSREILRAISSVRPSGKQKPFCVLGTSACSPGV